MVSSQVIFVFLGWNANEHISSSCQCSFFLVWQAVCWCSWFFNQGAHVGEFLEPNSMVHPLQTSSERNVSHKKLANHYRLQWSWPSRCMHFVQGFSITVGSLLHQLIPSEPWGLLVGASADPWCFLKLPQKERTKIIDPKTGTKKSIQKYWEGCFDWNSLEADTVDPLDFLGGFLIGESLAGCYVGRNYHDLNHHFLKPWRRPAKSV